MSKLISLTKNNPKIVFTIAGVAFGLTMFITFLISFVKEGGRISIPVVMLAAAVFLGLCGPLFDKFMYRGWQKTQRTIKRKA